MRKTHIRLAERADLESIRELVVELAIYEKEPNAVSASLEDYQVAYDSGLIKSFIAESDGSIVGMALFYDSYSTWKGKMLYLEDFVVKASHRRSGIGQQLFDATVNYARQTQCKLIKWQVLDWNQLALDFYKKQGATIEKEWWNGKIIFDSSRP